MKIMDTIPGLLQSLIDRYINVSSDDPDDSRRRRILNIILFFVGGVTFFVFVSGVIGSRFSNSNDEGVQLLLISSFVTLVASYFLYILNLRSVGWLASAIFLVFLSIVLAFSDTPEELVSGRSLVVFTIPIVMGSILLRPYFSFVFAGLSVIEIILIGSANNILDINPAVVGVFFMVAALSWLSSRTLEAALRDLRVINTELDKRVNERTRELSESLEREASQANQREAILNSIADGVVVFDNDGVAIVANPSSAAMIGKSSGNILGHKLVGLFSSEDVPVLQNELIKDLTLHPNEAPAFRINWNRKTLSVNAAEVRDNGGQSIGTVAVFRDVTREAELEKMKDTFMAIVSHELRTPLNAILGFAEMLKEQVYGPINEKQRNASTRVMDNANRLLLIVSELLDQAQIQSGRMKINNVMCSPAALLEELHGTMDTITASKGLKLITRLDEDVPDHLIGDPHRLQQILINLTNNAVKFTEKGEVCVSIKKFDEDFWQIQVSDTGEGIPKEALNYVFETFRQVEDSVTRKQGGVGLGLSIVKQLAELMGGRVSVTSEVGSGSMFIVTLPLKLG